MDFKVRIEKTHFPREKRVIVISDVHGHKTWLQRLLEKVGFCEEDILVLCGDYVERGTENLENLRYVMELCKQNNVYAILGNVDAWTCLRVENEKAETSEAAFDHIRFMGETYGTSILAQMGQEAGVPLNKPEDIPGAKKTFCKVFARELKFLHSLPVILEDDHFVFVHGGLTTDQIETLEETDAFALMKNDAFREKGMSFAALGKIVVTGHWPVVNYHRHRADCNPIFDRERNLLSIDGGCGVKSDGQLNAVIFCGDQVSFESYDDLPGVVAGEDQAESEDSINLTWSDSRVEILEQNAGLCRVKRVSDGRELCVPESYLFSYQGNTHCQDYTDFRLPVKAGDKLGFIRREGTGLLAKKNGTIGWYFGKVEEEKE